MARVATNRLQTRFSDERGSAGFSWIVVEPMGRASHALVDGDAVWLVDPIDWEPAIERATSLGTVQGVLQLLDRHGRDCAQVADRLGVPHMVAPDSVPRSRFSAVPVVRRRFWRETALWWAAERTLVVPEALGTTRLFTAGKAPLGVHLLLRMTPPKRALAGYAPLHLLVGHGQGLHGEETPGQIARALDESRRRLPQLIAGLPFSQRVDQR